MPAEKLTMRKIRELLRLKFEFNLGNRKIAHSCKMAHSTVGDYIRRFESSGLHWPLSDDIDDRILEQLLFRQPQINSSKKRPSRAAFARGRYRGDEPGHGRLLTVFTSTRSFAARLSP